jgi:phosphate:Na+ symporter
VLLPLVPSLTEPFSRLGGDPVHQVLGAHMAFNIGLALICLPLCGLIMQSMERLLPDQRPVDDPLSKPKYLDRMAFQSPNVALSNAALETVRMAELLERMFRTAVEALKSNKAEGLKAIRALDERLNGYQHDIQIYTAELTQNELSVQESRRALEIMLYVSNLEHAGDIIHLSLADRVKSKIKESINFSPAETAALDELIGIVLDSLRLASGVLGSGDIDGARRLIDQKACFRTIENRIINEQFRGGAHGRSLRRGALFVDLIRDLHTINSHVVSAGYPIVDAAGLLRETRVRTAEKKIS